MDFPNDRFGSVAVVREPVWYRKLDGLAVSQRRPGIAQLEMREIDWVHGRQGERARDLHPYHLPGWSERRTFPRCRRRPIRIDARVTASHSTRPVHGVAADVPALAATNPRSRYRSAAFDVAPRTTEHARPAVHRPRDGCNRRMRPTAPKCRHRAAAASSAGRLPHSLKSVSRMPRK